MAALTTDQFANFALSTLAGGGSGVGGSLTATDTTLLVKTGDGAKYSATTGGSFMVMLGSALGAHELVKVTARSTDTLTITRSQEGTTAQAWALGTFVQQVATAGNWSRLWKRVQGTVFNARDDYGAVGDGVTDDYANIQAAINAAQALATAALAAPTVAPSATANTGTGSAFTAAQTATLALSYVNAYGETTLSPTIGVTIATSGNDIMVALPTFPAGVSAINVYCSTSSGSATLARVSASVVAVTSAVSGGVVTITDFPATGNPAAPTSNGTGHAGGAVYLPAPTARYLVSQSPTISAPIAIFGDGAGSLIYVADGSTANGLAITNTSDVTVRGIAVNGNKANVSTAGTSYTTINGIYVYNSDSVLIHGCYVTNSYYGGIEIDTATNVLVDDCVCWGGRDNQIFVRPGCVNVLVRNCVAHGSTYSGIQAIHSDYVTFEGCLSYNNGPAPSTEGDGFGLEGCRYSSIIGCTAYGNSAQGIKVDYTVEGAGQQNSSHILISGNMIYGNNNPSYTTRGIQVMRSDHVTVRDNYLGGNYYGIQVSTSAAQVRIANNTIESCVKQSIYISDTSVTAPVEISGNRIVSGGSNGIDTQVTCYIRQNLIQGNTGEGVSLNTANGQVIEGNTILDNTDNGILVNSGANHEIRNNLFTNTSTAQKRALYEAGGGPTYLINNRIVSQSNQPYHLSNAASRYADEHTLEYVTITAAYTALVDDNIILCNAAAALTVTLPSASTVGAGHVYTIKDHNGTSATNVITLATTSAQTIDGAASKTITTAYGALRVISDGSNWSVI